MAKLVWDTTGDKILETGTSQGVLYVMDNTGAYPRGVAWNGLTGVDENPSGGEATKIYADDTIYGTLYSTEEFGCSIKAYTYPDEFEACDGSATLVTGATVSQQNRATFGLVYKTVLANDVAGNDFGYKLHLIYGCKASPSAKSYATINESPDAIEFSWEVTTTPVNVSGFKPTSVVVVDSTKFTTAAQQTCLAALETVLFGGTGAQEIARLPLPDEVKTILTPASN